jgi:pimeloyl-ACP methyl ester carboxylesterase
MLPTAYTRPANPVAPPSWSMLDGQPSHPWCSIVTELGVGMRPPDAKPLRQKPASGAAVRDMDHRELLAKIKAPTLVIAGKHDPATPPETNEYIKNHVPRCPLRGNQSNCS